MTTYSDLASSPQQSIEPVVLSGNAVSLPESYHVFEPNDNPFTQEIQSQPPPIMGKTQMKAAERAARKMHKIKSLEQAYQDHQDVMAGIASSAKPTKKQLKMMKENNIGLST
jgi:hypothetical protein